MTFPPYKSSVVNEVLVIFNGPSVSTDNDLPLCMCFPSQDNSNRWNRWSVALLLFISQVQKSFICSYDDGSSSSPTELFVI
jgi:hypothetical protein